MTSTQTDKFLKENKYNIEEELNAVRLKIYEKIKNMTPAEEVAYINSRAEHFIRQYGLQAAL